MQERTELHWIRQTIVRREVLIAELDIDAADATAVGFIGLAKTHKEVRAFLNPSSTTLL